eukprot:CAMPEP_0119362902 /NCGR_PEP_ID=MMETSP1334-20130426/9801_1 /TAXON_ID=127549 /ORGANISM="Calcidiscus leptoporus, Strain RCC1130" /LENGTH=227 /DNA_ID=CAMNT_0007378171 /DNA_START=88 /DNA_END=771 /DNA_ORIENTATION=+
MAATTGQPVSVPTAEPVTGQPVDSLLSAEAKYLRARKTAKWLNIVAALLLSIVAFHELFAKDEQGASNCNPLLVRVVMGWMGVIGLLMILAELEVALVRKHIHVLAYRSGRAAAGLMVGTICMAAAPVELPMAATGYNYNEGAFVTSVQYHFLIVGFIVICAAVYNIVVSIKHKVYVFAKKRSGGKARAGEEEGDGEEGGVWPPDSPSGKEGSAKGVAAPSGPTALV